MRLNGKGDDIVVKKSLQVYQLIRVLIQCNSIHDHVSCKVKKVKEELTSTSIILYPSRMASSAALAQLICNW